VAPWLECKTHEPVAGTLARSSSVTRAARSPRICTTSRQPRSSLATDAYGKFVYVPKIDADYLFGYSVGTGGSTLEPLPLNPLPPQNTYTLPASQPRAMVLRYSRRDREMLQVPE
jgi:hypothetical protein